jgi:hypothetical protein
MSPNSAESRPRTARDTAAELAYLTPGLKTPALAGAVERLAERARSENRTPQEYLATRDASGGELRIRAPRFPARTALEDFDFEHQRSVNRQTIAHLGTLDVMAARENVILLGPPGTGKTHLAFGLGVRACQAGHRVCFATASQWVARLAEAHAAGNLHLWAPGKRRAGASEACSRRFWPTAEPTADDRPHQGAIGDDSAA